MIVIDPNDNMSHVQQYFLTRIDNPSYIQIFAFKMLWSLSSI